MNDYESNVFNNVIYFLEDAKLELTEIEDDEHTLSCKVWWDIQDIIDMIKENKNECCV